MYERDNGYYSAVQEEEREHRRQREEEMRRRLEELQEQTMREQEREQEEYERAMELRYFCGREGHKLQASEHGTSCRCGKEFVEVFFA